MMQDLAMIVLDICNNSIHAGAHHIQILINEDAKQDLLTLSIRDDGKGMSQEFLKKATDPFTTSRTTRKIGLGLAFFKGLADQCNGTFTLTSKENCGTEVSATIQLSHIDTPPLGNLAETMVTCIQADESIDYILTYKTEDNCFVFNSKEVKEMLEDVSLNEPKILIWIKEYIQEQIDLVQKRRNL